MASGGRATSDSPPREKVISYFGLGNSDFNFFF